MQSPGPIHAAWFGISVLILLMLGCKSSDGENEGGLLPQTMVTVRAEVNDGAEPIAGANCRLVNRQGVEQAQSTANDLGVFDLQAPPGSQGFLQCVPPQFTQFQLSAFVSTEGKAVGDIVPATGREFVSPQSTVVAIIIAQENPHNPQARKEQLEAALAARAPDLTALVEATTVLVQSMIDAEVDVAIDTSTGSEGNESDGDAGSTGGASGNVNDGAEFSPMPRAVCEFVTSAEGEVIVDTALHDLFVDGQVTRPDLQPVAALVNQALATRATAIAAAFTRFFPQSLGRLARTIAADENAAEPGRYFLPIPPRLSGLVRCHPPHQDALLLLNPLPALRPGERLGNQDVTPATTMFGLQVAGRLVDSNLTALKENFAQDMAGLQVGVIQDDGQILGFELLNEPAIGNNNVKLIAFVATALFNAFYKEEINANFVGTLLAWVTDTTVDPDRLAEDPAISPGQAKTIANIMNTAAANAEQELQIEVDTALSTAQLRVRVQAVGDDAALSGATVKLASNQVQCQNCPAVTNDRGEVVLSLAGVPKDRATPLQVGVSLQDFRNKSVRTVVTALATVTVEVDLVRVSADTSKGGGSN